MSAFLEIQNLTPFPMVWAQLDPSRSREGNLLDAPLESRRGFLVSDVEPGSYALACGFDVSRAGEVLPERCHGPAIALRAGDAQCAIVHYERGAGFRVEYRDARVAEESGVRTRDGATRYRWTPVSGDVTAKA